MNFMSIEVAARKFLFPPPDARPSLTELDGLFSAAGQDEGTAQAEVPFSHNHLHDLESLWWVAVWVVFYNYFLEETSSRDHPSFTLQDTAEQLRLARTLFPPALDSTSRRDGFQNPKSFQNTCAGLPSNKKAICDGLNFVRRLLISHYNAIEARYPESVDPDSSSDDIYDGFTQVFSRSETVSHGLKLKFIPDIYRELLKEENLKRPRSESTNDTGVAQKAQRK
jgi:hypothetical protein